VKKSFSVLVIAASLALPFAASLAGESARATEGKMLVSADGARLGAVYRVANDGSAQLVVNGKMATVPVSTLSVVDGTLMTSLSKSDVRNLR
jgi:hypothetical protein